MNGSATRPVYSHMTRDCSAIESLLPLSVSGDLDAANLERVREHLPVCELCRQTEAEYLRIISASRELYGPEYRLSEATRRRIGAEAALQVERRPWRLAFPGLGLWSLSPRPGLLATVSAIVIALVVLPIALRQAPAPSGEEAVTVQVENQGSAIHLAWTDGSRGSYTVYKSSDPRDLRRAEVHRVTGNSWVDENPGSSPVVFYRIE